MAGVAARLPSLDRGLRRLAALVEARGVGAVAGAAAAAGSKKNGRESAPTVLLLDSQSARSVYGGEAIGIDGGKRVRGRKRSVLSDVDGVVVAMRIDAANRHDVAIAREWLPEVVKTMPTVRVIKADGGYDNPRLRAQLAAQGFELQAQNLCGTDGSFQPVDGRWRIEQCFGVLRHARRQVREFERSTWAAQAMCMLAALRLELRRLCNNVRRWDQVTV